MEEFIVEDYGEGVGEIIEIIGEEVKEEVKKGRKANRAKKFCNTCKRSHAKKCKLCEYCKKSFTNLPIHKKHCPQNPSQSNTEITCETCKKKMHIRSKAKHAKNCKRYACGYCDRRYMDIDRLALHISNFHDRERPTCDFCGLQTLSISDMITHMR